jgi:hypothetical protein
LGQIDKHEESEANFNQQIKYDIKVIELHRKLSIPKAPHHDLTKCAVSKLRIPDILILSAVRKRIQML